MEARFAFGITVKRKGIANHRKYYRHIMRIIATDPCRGQAFDGASNKSGIGNGVQALIKREEEHALYVHCRAHNLSLCIQSTTKQSQLMRNVIEFLFVLIQLITYSPKHLSLFNHMRSQVFIDTGETTPAIRTLCPTRWTVRNSAINSILMNYESIIYTLDEVRKGNDEYAAKANGLLQQMESFEIFFGLKVSYLIFSNSEQLLTSMQAKNTTVSDATNGAHLLVTHLKSQRTESSFETFYEFVLKAFSELTDEPCLPKYRKTPKRFDDVHSLETLLLKASNGIIDEPEEILLQYLKKDINKKCFIAQLSMLQDMIQNAQQNSIKKVTSLQTIADSMNKSDIYKHKLGEIDKVLKVYFTVPVTTATAERSFSALRRLKTFVRSTMTQERLNNLLMLYVHDSLTDSLDLADVGSQFV
ncbi:PREDICTED: zinc finger MYM-type protein 1-like [Amphimedon queenslandica]|uniref:HAT C-terminal dimerisation domain-containing protein n=2 Tax=Amphimedon queenslandica TaxID=400682 RepID=A0AAN0IPI1_AMPQE|nr:PREDICTED: zinc finger MYM-type protein 1-like [Amphimedon queenslandica]|eukprot:XP_011405553.1 PREDICTED: zinc finger MYM-type protein 1-like [Amphimedon queenslandica]